MDSDPPTLTDPDIPAAGGGGEPALDAGLLTSPPDFDPGAAGAPPAGAGDAPLVDANRQHPEADILQDLACTPDPTVPGRYRADLSKAWQIFYVFGGVTYSLALRAAEQHLARPDLQLRSASAAFCEAVPAGPIRIDVEVIRSGGAAAQVHVRLRPEGAITDALVVTAVFGRNLQEIIPSFVDVSRPDFPPPEQCRDMPRLRRGADSSFPTMPFHRQVMWRAPDGWPAWEDAPPSGRAESRSWFRFNRSPLRPDGTWEPTCLAVPADVVAPAARAGAMARGDESEFFVISLQIDLYLLGPVRGDWVLQDADALSVADGYASGTARLWAADGTLAALAIQQAMVRTVPPVD